MQALQRVGAGNFTLAEAVATAQPPSVGRFQAAQGAGPSVIIEISAEARQLAAAGRFSDGAARPVTPVEAPSVGRFGSEERGRFAEAPSVGRFASAERGRFTEAPSVGRFADPALSIGRFGEAPSAGRFSAAMQGLAPRG